jgi:hypothetical protein
MRLVQRFRARSRRAQPCPGGAIGRIPPQEFLREIGAIVLRDAGGLRG